MIFQKSINIKNKPGINLQFLAGLFLILSGLVHALIWLYAPTSWEGPLSIRKPILFGLSTGITLVSLGWVASKLTPRKGDNFLWSIFALGMIIEVLLITMQYWRGVPSHFNRATPFDSTILLVIELLITYATIIIIDLTCRCMYNISGSRELKLAIRGGMFLLVIGCLLGFYIDYHGHKQVALGLAPEIIGQAGVAKFPHGVPLHVIQLLPMFVWLMERFHIINSKRYILLNIALTLSLLTSLFSLIQSLTGHARWDLSWYINTSF